MKYYSKSEEKSDECDESESEDASINAGNNFINVSLGVSVGGFACGAHASLILIKICDFVRTSICAYA